jgi:polyphosphate kinase
MIELIRGQARPGGRIVLKMNALVDPDMIDALYEASGAGAEIDLIVRSICCLRPGVSGQSERIRVRSLVGRYLEHSRIFRFGEHEEVMHYIGSADLMQRNLDRRVEALVPVSDPALAARLDQILDVLMQDDTLAWTLGADGTWTKIRGERGIDAQQRLQELAVERAGSRRP